MFAKNDNFELEICVTVKKGRTALQREASLVADLLASAARHPPHTGARGGMSDARTETPLYAFSRAIDRESLAGL